MAARAALFNYKRLRVASVPDTENSSDDVATECMEHFAKRLEPLNLGLDESNENIRVRDECESHRKAKCRRPSLDVIETFETKATPSCFESPENPKVMRLEQKFAEFKSILSEYALKRDVTPAVGQLRKLELLRSEIRRQKLKTFRELQQKTYSSETPEQNSCSNGDLTTDLKCESSEIERSALDKTSSSESSFLTLERKVSFSEEAEVIGFADQEYDRESHPVSPLSVLENLVLKAFGTYPDDFPELYGYCGRW